MDHHHRITSKQGQTMLDNVRSICNALLEVDEIIDGFGHTTFKVRGKSFIMMGESAEGPILSFKSDRENQEILLQQNRFVRTPYIGQHGWASTKTGEPVDWNELRELLKEAYLRAAPKRLVKQLLQ